MANNTNKARERIKQRRKERKTPRNKPAQFKDLGSKGFNFQGVQFDKSGQVRRPTSSKGIRLLQDTVRRTSQGTRRSPDQQLAQQKRLQLGLDKPINTGIPTEEFNQQNQPKENLRNVFEEEKAKSLNQLAEVGLLDINNLQSSAPEAPKLTLSEAVFGSPFGDNVVPIGGRLGGGGLPIAPTQQIPQVAGGLIDAPRKTFNALNIGKLPKSAASLNIGKAGKTGKDIVSRNFATNTKNVKLTSTFIEKVFQHLTNPKVISGLILGSIGTYPFAGFIREEALQQAGFAMFTAEQNDNPEALANAITLQEETLNPEGWRRLFAAIPYTNILSRLEDYYDGARVQLENYKKIYNERYGELP